MEKVTRLALIEEKNQAGSNVKTCGFLREGPCLKLIYRKSNLYESEEAGWRVFAWDLQGQTVRAVSAEEKSRLIAYAASRKHDSLLWEIGRVKSAAADIPLAEWGLPSPLDYCRKSDRAYADDLVKLRGDQSYRNAIIARFTALPVSGRIRKILSRMEENKNSLKGLNIMKSLPLSFRKRLSRR